MEWPSKSAVYEQAGNGFADDNPWLPAASSSHDSTSMRAETPATTSSLNGQTNAKAGPPANPLYQGSPELGSQAEPSTSHSNPGNGHMNPEATRPTLYRLTSNSLSGLLNGLDSLSFQNASQESLSTEDTGINGTRRSLDELRRLSIKGKGRAADDDYLSDTFLGSQSLQETRPRGREALLHPVEEGDTLQRLALLYGCTVPAIRSANKMWAKDPIFPRKTLYIPLDACKQPPSKEVEFVQKSGEDEIQVYFRQPKVGPTQPFGQNSGKTGFASAPGRTRSSSLRLEALAEMPRPLTPYRDSEPTSSMNSPFSSQRSSFSHARQTSASSHFNYLSNTTSEYGSSDDGLGQQSMSPAPDTRTNGMVPHSSNGDDSAGYGQSLSYASRNAQPPSSTLQKTLQIVRVPGTSVMKPASSGLNATRAQGRSPLISVDNLEEPTPSSSLHDSVVSVSSTSLGAPIPSNDRLSALSGTPANLRLRPRSPFDPATATASNHSSPGDSVLPTRPPPRSRKISKEAVPTTAQSGKSNQTLRLPGTLGKYITSASAGLVSSLMGDKNASNTGWLATSELETEMQMAREYQSRQQHRTSISSDRTLHNRSRSSVSLRSHQPENSAKSRRPPSLSGSRQPTSDDLFAI